MKEVTKDEYKDIHASNNSVQRYLSMIDKSDMSLRQKKLIKKFVRELKIGKAGKKVKDRRISNYLQFLLKLHRYFKEDLDKCERKFEKFYEDLQNNKILKRNKMPYSDNSKNEFTKTLKRYVGWIWKLDSKKYHTYLKWIKDFDNKSNKKAITLKECRKIVDSLESKGKIRDSALIYFLFDVGARIEEALNVRIKDLTKFKERNEFKVHIRGTKTETSNRKVALTYSNNLIKKWLEKHPTKKQEDYLFPLQYDNTRKIIREVSKSVLGFNLTPHELRHSSATHFVVGYGARNIMLFYYKYGWKQGSKEAQRYVHKVIFENEEESEKMLESFRKNDYNRIMETHKKIEEENKKYKEEVERQKEDLENIQKKTKKLMDLFNSPEFQKIKKTLIVK